MPYSGPDDPTLPANVRKLPAVRRRQWLHVYNGERSSGRSDGDAHRIANGVLKGDKDMPDALETKVAPFVDYEAKVDGELGIVEGYASVFGDRDFGGDKTFPGAFTKSLAERGEKVMYIPAHDLHIHVKDIPGVPLKVSEDSKGLHTQTQFFLDTQAGKDSFRVLQAYQKAGRPIGLSYTYKALKFDRVRDGRDLKELDLFEYGHCALPMLDSARTTGTKSFTTNITEGKLEGLISEGKQIDQECFPIDNEDDVRAAVAEAESGYSSWDIKDVYMTRRHIRQRAKELGYEDLIPDSWLGKSGILSVRTIDADDEKLLADFEMELGRGVTEEGKQAITAALAAMKDAFTQEEGRTAAKSEETKELERKRQEIEEALERVQLR